LFPRWNNNDLMKLVDVVSVKVLQGFEVELAFDDGFVRRLDLDPYLHGPILEPLRADIDPEVLRHGLTPAARETS